MSRWFTIVASVLAGALASIAILATVFFISWRFAVSEQTAELHRSAERMLQRAEAIYAEATAALRRVEGTDAEPCSRDHILLMKQATTDELFVDNVAYTAGGLVRCNAYGPVELVISATEIDVVQPDGIPLNVNYLRPASPPKPTLVVKLGSHRALVDQRNFYDELVSPGAARYFTLHTLNGIAIESGWNGAPVEAAADEEISSVYELKSANWVLSVSAPRLAFLPYMEPQATTASLLAGILTLLLVSGILCLRLRPVGGKNLIEQALRQRLFVVYYQPIMDLVTQRCIAAEALVRLRQPDGVLVRPEVFIPFAEDSGLIQPLTDYILDSVVREMTALLGENRSMHISINVAAIDIVSGRILGSLDRALKDTDIAPEQIWLEMTERALMNIEQARPTLDELRRRGYRIAIDDFGTGYSGLQYLAQLPVQMLKIDKSFIETIGTGAPTSRVTGHIIAMARELSLRLVAEGVETEAQVAFLRNERVEYAQGWLFSPAVPADEFLTFLARSNASAGAVDG